MRLGAHTWRKAVDEQIAPSVRAGLVAVGRGTVDGMDRLAGAVMGENAKEETYGRVSETLGALGTIARAVVVGEDEAAGEEASYEYDYSDYDTRRQDEEGSFAYQQLDPSEYQANIHYPPHFQTYPDYVHDLDPRLPNPPHLPPAHYLTSFSHRDSRPLFTASGRPRQQTVDEALYILGKNILGQNITDRLLPVAKQVADGFEQMGEGFDTITNALPLPTVEFDEQGVRVKTVNEDEASARDERNAQASSSSTAARDNAPRCTTPTKGSGKCMDIQNCPLLLADLDLLRKSICFKSLFVPGVCCPESG